MSALPALPAPRFASGQVVRFKPRGVNVVAIGELRPTLIVLAIHVDDGREPQYFLLRPNGDCTVAKESNLEAV